MAESELVILSRLGAIRVREEADGFVGSGPAQEVWAYWVSRGELVDGGMSQAGDGGWVRFQP